MADSTAYMTIAISKGLSPWKVGWSETWQGDNNARRRCREFLKGEWARLIGSTSTGRSERCSSSFGRRYRVIGTALNPHPV